MRICKKIFKALIVLAVFQTALMFNNTFSKEVLAMDKPVELQFIEFAKSPNYFPPRYYQPIFPRDSFGQVRGKIKVKNLGYFKKVTLHYADLGYWRDTTAEYVKTNTDGTEVWEFFLDQLDYLSGEIAIKYEVNGQTYWDNNNGNDYNISFENGAYFTLGKSNMIINRYGDPKYCYIDSNDNKLNFGIILKKLSSKGSVKVRYTEDEWNSYKDFIVEYNSEDTLQSIYKAIQIPISKDTNKVDFAICNEVDGVEYWDNNFERNYTVVRK